MMGKILLNFFFGTVAWSPVEAASAAVKVNWQLLKTAPENTFLPPVSFCCGITLGDSTWLSAASDSLGVSRDWM